MRRLVAIACTFALVACASSRDRIEEKREPIIGGSDDDTDTFVVGIDVRAPTFVGSCTGTLLAPNLVVTARHCVSEIPDGFTCPNAFNKVYSNFDPSVFTVSQARALYTNFDKIGAPSWSVRAVFYPNGATCTDGDSELACALCDFDVALLELAPAADGSYPATEFPTPADAPPTIGGAYASIGYGCTTLRDDAGVCGIGSRTSAEGSLVTSVASYELSAIAGVCDGDSGSPLYDRGTHVVYGIAARADGDCTHGVFTRLDTELDWLRRYAAIAATDGGYTPASWVTAGPAQTADAGAGARSDDACAFSPSTPSSAWIFALPAIAFAVLGHRRATRLARREPFA